MSTTGTLPTAVNGPSLLPIAMEAIHRLVLTTVTNFSPVYDTVLPRLVV